MNIEDYRNYCLAKAQTTESTPFHNDDNTLVFKVAGKMFTATGIAEFESIALKCPPEEVQSMREEFEGVTVQPYMAKNHWNRIVMNSDVPDELIYTWIDRSYELVVQKLPKKLREELLGK